MYLWNKIVRHANIIYSTMNREKVNKRQFLKGLGGLGATVGLAGCGDTDNGSPVDDSSDTVDTEDDGSDTSEPDFNISLDTPDEFEEGEQVENIIEVENNGNATGEYTGEYSLENGENISGTLNTELLEPGDSQTFHLNELLEETPGQGEYTLNVNGEQTQFNILPEMFTWQDVLDSEERRHREIAETNHVGQSNIQLANQSRIRDADPDNYDELLEAILQTNMDVTQGLGDRGFNSDATSASMSEALGVVNTLLIENDINARQMNGPTGGHGYGLVIFRDHPFSLADSNAPFAGRVEDRRLNDRNDATYDRIGSRIIDTDYDDLDDADKRAARRLIKQGIMIEDAPRRWNDIPHTDVHPDVIDSYLERYFDDDGDFIFDKFRPVLGSLKMAAAEEYVDGHGQLITSPADELPEVPNDPQQYSKFIDNLLDQHVEIYSEESYNEELDEEWRN